MFVLCCVCVSTRERDSLNEGMTVRRNEEIFDHSQGLSNQIALRTYLDQLIHVLIDHFRTDVITRSEHCQWPCS